MVVTNKYLLISFIITCHFHDYEYLLSYTGSLPLMLLGKFSTVADNWPNVDPHLEPCDQSSMETIVPALPSVQLKIIIKFIIWHFLHDVSINNFHQH